MFFLITLFFFFNALFRFHFFTSNSWRNYPLFFFLQTIFSTTLIAIAQNPIPIPNPAINHSVLLQNSITLSTPIRGMICSLHGSNATDKVLRFRFQLNLHTLASPPLHFLFTNLLFPCYSSVLIEFNIFPCYFYRFIELISNYNLITSCHLSYYKSLDLMKMLPERLLLLQHQ